MIKKYFNRNARFCLRKEFFLSLIGFLFLFFLAIYSYRDINNIILLRAESEDVIYYIYVLVIIGLFMLSAFMYHVFLGDNLKCVCWLIGLMPITGHISKVYGIVSYTEQDSRRWEEKISTTTILIIFHFFILYVRNILRRKSRLILSEFELLLILFGVLVTISQIVNHQFINAGLLSISAVWQYVFLYYILKYSITKYLDLNYIIVSILIAVFLNIAFRESIDVYIKTAVFAGEGTQERISGLVFGPAVTYSGLVAMTLCLLFYMFIKSNMVSEKIFWLLLFVFLLNELWFTNTRGGILAFLIAIPIFLSYKEFRVPLLKLIGIVFVIMLVLVNIIEYKGSRLIASGLKSLEGLSRIDIFLDYVPYFFDNYGFGNGLGKYRTISYISGNMEYDISAHSLIQNISDGAGAFSAITFMLLIVYVMARLIKNIYITRFNREISIILLAALTTWFVFANTTGISILYYYPTEGTILFYLILFMSNIVGRNILGKYINDNKVTKII